MKNDTPQRSDAQSLSNMVTAVRGVVVIVTDDEHEPGIGAAIAAAADLGSANDVPVILYDRSEETWADSQHPDGPMKAGDKRLGDRAHLQEKMSAVEARGATPLAWVATLPSISAVETALSETGADVVVVPGVLHRHLLERVVEGGSTGETIVAMLRRNPALTATVVEFGDDGPQVLNA